MLYKKSAHLIHFPRSDSNVSAGRIILFSILIIIAIGAFFLKLPISCSHPITLFQAVFTAASATCVTGLSIVPFHEFSFFGKFILLLLIQIGGLGLMTFSFFLTWKISGGLGVADKLMAKEILSFDRIGKMHNFIASIFLITFSLELLGAVFLFFKMIKFFDLGSAIFYSVFYSVSAFCNAGITPNVGGFDVFSRDLLIMSVLSGLVFLGGIGFPVIYELIEKLLFKFGLLEAKDVNMRLSLHSKIVLSSSIFLIVLGAVALLIIQSEAIVDADLSLKGFIGVIFNSISLRSAGFQTDSIATFPRAALFFCCSLMLIGASPGSTGGGLKTTTFCVILAGILATLRGRNQVTIFGRAISSTQVTKAFSIFTMVIALIFITMTALLITDPKAKAFSLFFEVVSAISTVGIDGRITKNLSMAGQLVIMIAMIAGRIGSLTFIFAFRKPAIRTTYTLPEEKILIG